MKKNLLLLSSVSLLMSACSGEGGTAVFSGSDLPADPEKIIIEWHEGGGMLPEGQEIYLSTDSSYYSMWRDQTHQKLYFNTSAEELKSIYQVFTDNDFDKIRLLEEQEVYDRGGTSISLNADGKNFSKNNSGMTFLHEDDYEEYNAIENNIYDFAKSKIENQKTKTTVKIGNELLAGNYLIYININGNIAYNSDTDDSLLTQLDTLLYTASNEFILNLYNKDSLNYYGSPSFIESVYLTKEISDTSNTVLFSLDKKGKITAK
jgi:hypothetical protein